MSEEISAKVICDSVAPHGKRLTTLQIHVPKFLLAEINTHRMLSKNYNSSRAIPAKKMRAAATFAPTTFGKNQPGMVSEEELSPFKQGAAQAVWASSRMFASFHHKALEMLGVHKQHANRTIEPYVWCDGVISGTDWENFFRQRMHPDAQPEIQALAYAMFDEMCDSQPKQLAVGDYHLPYIKPEDYIFLRRFNSHQSIFQAIKDISAARCARVSYGLDKPFDITADIERGKKLKAANPPHYSPYEHVAIAIESAHTTFGNFAGWQQYRYQLEREQAKELSKFVKLKYAS